MHQLSFPKSFPDSEELFFLNLLLCKDADFLLLYEEWKSRVVFDDIDYATLGLLPLLYKRLQKFNLKDKTTAKIRGVYKLAWVKNQCLFRSLSEIVPLLESHGISVLVLKGVPLLMTVYKDVGARFLTDADILISPGNVKKVLQIMSEAGWRIQNLRFPSYNHFSEESLQRIVKEATFINQQGIQIDIHWRLFDRSDNRADIFKFDDFLGRSTAFHFKNVKYNKLAPEDMLIHVITHGAEGNMHRPFRWVADAVTIIRSSDINWNQLFEEIRKSDYVVEMYVAFSFLLQHNFIVLPDFFVQSLSAIPLLKTDIKKYYQMANTPYEYVWFGSVPRFWQTYWKYESRGVLPISLYYFVDYLSRAWGFTNKWEIFPFVFRKFKSRIEYYLKMR